MATFGYAIGWVVAFCLVGIGIAVWPWSIKHDEIYLEGAQFHKLRTPFRYWSAIIFNSVVGCGAGGFMLYRLLYHGLTFDAF